ncbi:MAG: ATP-binding protein [Pirellulales bacterium]
MPTNHGGSDSAIRVDKHPVVNPQVDWLNEADMEDVEVLKRFLQREREARKEAERLLEERSRELFKANCELQQTVHAFQNQIRRTQAIVDSAAEAIVIIDSSGNIDAFNPAAEEVFACPAGYAIGRRIVEFIPTAMFCLEVAGMSDLERELWAPEGFGEVHGLRADGERVMLELVIGAFEDNGRNFHIVIMRDLTRRKQLEAQLAHAQKMESVGQLAAGIAHEINTPIQYVGDNIRFLMSSFEDVRKLLDKYQAFAEQHADQDAEAIERIRETEDLIDLPFLNDEIPAAIDQSLQGVESVAKIVRAMKDFSHPGTEEKQQINLNQAIESTLTVSRNVWKYCCDLETHFDTTLPLVPCLPCDLNQAILNLITNAAHAMESAGCGKGGKRGTLQVATIRDGDYVIIEVGDSGTGIPENIRNRIFDPFFTTKPMGQGTGQGLAITYNIVVEKHQGELSFESQVGKGTTFRLRIPLISKNEEPDPLAAASAALAETKLGTVGSYA